MATEASLGSRLDALVASAVGSGGPGAAVAVTRGDDVVHEVCFGLADVEWRQPISPDTVFAIGSLTKPCTALATVLTARAGMLDLDAPVSEYVPGYPAPGAHATLRHLLTHTSGIPDFLSLPGFREQVEPLVRTGEDLVAAFADQPLQFAPGTRYAYSNSGYRLLDVVVSTVTATPFDRALADLVLRPAGMTTAAVPGDGDVVARRARGYARDGARLHATAPTSTTVSGGAGGMVASLEDMVAFDRALRRNRLVDEGTDHRMLNPLRLRSGHTEGYGLGWVLGSFRGAAVAGHTGGIDGFSALYARFPDRDAGVVVLSNIDGFGAARLARDVAALALGLPAPDLGHEDGEVPSHCCGHYGDGSAEVELVADGDGLALRGTAGNRRLRRRTARLWADADDPDVTLRLDRVAANDPAITVESPFTWWTGYRLPGCDDATDDAGRDAASTASTMPM